MNRKRDLIFGLAAGLIFGMQTITVEAQDGDGRYIVGGGVPGSVSYNVGVGLSSLAQIVLLPEENLSLLPAATEGFDQSLQQLINGESHFAIVDSVAAHRAFVEAGDRLTAVATLWHEVDHFLIANEYIQSGTISDLAILQSENLATDLRNPEATRELLARFGVRLQPQIAPSSSDWETRRDQFAQGAIGGLAITGLVPSSSVQDMLKEFEGKAQLLEFSHWQMAQVGDGWHIHSLTSDDYPELSRQVDTMARTMLLVARSDVPEEAVYEIVEMMFDNLPYLTNLDEAAAQISLNHAVMEINLPLHPGASRYYTEKGVLVDGVAGQLDAAVDHSAHGGENGAHPPEHVHDEAMLARSRAEVHDGDVILKIGRPEVLSHPGTEIYAIYFGLGKVEPAEEDAGKIREITRRIMTAYDTYGREPEVYVEGHTDRMGSWDTNYRIAHLRARSILDRLVAEGVPESWLHISDYSEEGLAVPTADNVPEERNRRVEITLIPQE